MPLTYYIEYIENIDGEIIGSPKSQSPISAIEAYHNNPSEIIEQNAQAIVQIGAELPSGPENVGTGFVINQDGLIVTNLHVVVGAKRIVIIFKGNKWTSDVFVAGFSEANDICILKINATDLPVVSLGDTKSLNRNDILVSTSISLKGKYDILTGEFIDRKDVYGLILLRHTMAGGPGVSGSPVFNTQGKVVGMYNRGYDDMKNWRFAIPIEDVKKMNTQDKPISLEEFNSVLDKAYLLFCAAQNAMSSGNANKAVELYQKAVELKPDFANAYTALSLAYLQSGRFPEALEAIIKAVEITPNSVEVQNNLAGTYLANRMFPEALSAAEKAAAMEPDYSKAHEAVGVAFYYMGNFIKAKAAFEQAVSIDSNRCFSNSYLAVIYGRESDNISAKRFYDKAVKSNCSIIPEIAHEMRKFGL
jgi:Tfp pilus assembly protein PilF